jgi:putative Ca2+/H+ antiporter (TMEM165/GDT1 family)
MAWRGLTHARAAPMSRAMVQAIVYVVAITAFVIFCVWLAWADSAVHDAEAN